MEKAIDREKKKKKVSLQEAHIGNHRCQILTNNNCFNETCFLSQSKEEFLPKTTLSPNWLGKGQKFCAPDFHLHVLFKHCSLQNGV